MMRFKKIAHRQGWIKRAVHCEKGIAATEFALIMPLLIILFFGMLEASEALTVNRRVSKAVNTLSDLTAQLDTVSPSEFDNLVTGVLEIMNPSDISNIQIKISSIIPDSNGDPIIHWSRDDDGNTPYVVGDDYTKMDNASVLDAGGSVIIAEIYYPHTLAISSHFFGSPIIFERQSIRWPRNAGILRVQFCTAPGSCTS